MSTTTASAPAAQNYNLGVTRCSDWLGQARSLWVEHPFFFLAMAAVVVLLRRTLDALAMDVFIVVSYLTDAWIFSWLVLGVSQARDGSAWSMLKAGGKSMWGRLFAVLKTILWGIPSALTSYVIFLLVPEGVQALVVIQGNVLLATSLLFTALLVGGFISMLLALLPVLAAIQMARDPHATLMSCGLWAYRGVRAGIRPLAVLFVLLLFGALVCNTVTTWVLGHLPVGVFSDWTVDEVMDTLFQAPTTTFLVMNVFLALLPGMANDLLRSADIDLSDEIFSDDDKVVQGDAFGIRILEHAGHALRLLSMLSVVFLVIYVWFSGYTEAIKWSVLALATHTWGGSFRKSAQAWRNKGAWHLRYRFAITPLILLAIFVFLAVVFDTEE
jgi:hypothetical protein